MTFALGASAERVLQLVMKEFRQLMRDPRLARIVLIAPVIQLIIFGYAVSTDLTSTPTLVVDHDRSVASRDFVNAFTSSGYFRIVGRSDQPRDLVRALDRGEALVGLEIPVGFARESQSGQGAVVQVLVDGTNSNSATVALGYAERIASAYGATLVPTTLPGGVDLQARAWFNPDLSSRNYNVPAVVGAIILLVCLLLTSLAVVREREIGTLEQLMVSPMTARELIAGKTIPFAIIGLIDLAVVMVVALAWFAVPFEGHLVTLLAASLLYLMSCLGVGLLISTMSSTQQEAFMASFLVFMPAILLSGFMFPISSMPEGFQWLTALNPVRHYLVIVRGVFLKGAGFSAMAAEFGALLALGTGLLWIAAARFRKRVT
ncbi:MAG TPA: ABC transporter permease [Gemmatimonadales bacterium]|nr:ABC transporter permease [Gemmatimonadales bacterium]